MSVKYYITENFKISTQLAGVMRSVFCGWTSVYIFGNEMDICLIFVESEKESAVQEQKTDQWIYKGWSGEMLHMLQVWSGEGKLGAPHNKRNRE